MLIYDLKTIFKKRKSIEGINIPNKLMKNKFPLDFSSYDFQIGNKYAKGKFDKPEIYKQQIEYKIMNDEKDFTKCEIYFYRGFLYFGTKNIEDENNVVIFKKIDIKLIEASQDYVNDKDNIDNCLQIKLDDGNNEIILLKFENKNIRKDFKDLINKKIMTSNNDERMQFSQFFEELIRKYKNNEDIIDENDDEF